MRETAQTALPAAVADAASERIAPPLKRTRLASVRVSPGSYLAAASILTFAAALLFRSGQDLAALAAIILAWIITPALALTDRISFDGHTLSRKGLIPFLLQLSGALSLHLRLEDIERVETSAVRTLRRGGRVRYRYRSEVTGRGRSFVFVSGGGAYRKMVRALFPLLGYDKVDARSSELRDYYADPKTLRLNLEFLRLASLEVLEGATGDLQAGTKRTPRHGRAIEGAEPTATAVERGRLLRLAANELRAAGRLRESAEAFRRALLVIPHDGWLIYEFARFLRSQASAARDSRLLARARAGLRLAMRRSEDDAALLSRIGESFFEHGELAQATRSFKRALEVNPAAFRAELGLAEVALRGGKLAHVIHHYDAAARITPDEALGRYARRESDYYARLSNDDGYLAAELRRIGWLQHLLPARRVAARLILASILLALLGPSFDETLEGIGWSLASSSLIAWVGIATAIRWLTPRRELHLAE
ncbi:MAG TPA: hypothetical protein VF723_10085 [Pyrinomonadaceae bacterium]|jgi:tetratricopeptide (TPR) repeat protein